MFNSLRRFHTMNGITSVFLTQANTSRTLSVPIIHKEEVVSAFVVSRPKDYSKLEEELLKAIANYIAPSVYEFQKNKAHHFIPTSTS